MDDTVFVSMMQGFRYGLADQGDGDSQSMGRTGTVDCMLLANELPEKSMRVSTERWTSGLVPPEGDFSEACVTERASGNGLFDKASRLANQAIEVLPLDIPHREIMDAFVLANVIDGHNVIVIELGCGLGFDQKTPDLHVARAMHGRQNFQRDFAPQSFLGGQIDDAHAAMAQLLSQLKVTQLLNKRTAERRDGMSVCEKPIVLSLLGPCWPLGSWPLGSSRERSPDGPADCVSSRSPPSSQ